MSGHTFERKDPARPAVVRRSAATACDRRRRRLRSRPRGAPKPSGRGSDGTARASRARRSSCASPTRAIAGCSISSRSCGATASFASGYVTRVAMGGDGQLGAEGQLALTLRLWSATPVAIDAAAAFGGELRGSAAAGAAPRRNARRQGVPRAAAADVQSEPRAALARRGPRSPLSPDAPAAARHRLRARRRSKRRPERHVARRAAQSRRRRHAEPPRGRNEPVPPPARGQSRRLVSVGRRGAVARAPRKESRSCCRSAIRRATGAT